MTKKKDHLYYCMDLARSVLAGGAAKALCGREREFTRESFDDLAYYDTCKECMSKAAEDATDGRITTRVKRPWLDVLETGFIELNETKRQPLYTYTITTGNAVAWDIKAA